MSVKIEGQRISGYTGANGEHEFDRAISKAKETATVSGNAPKDPSEGIKDRDSDKIDQFRLATNNETWPPVEKITIVEVPEQIRSQLKLNADVVAYRAEGDEKITIIRREDNPKFYDYISAISRIPGKDLDLAKLSISGSTPDVRREFVRDDNPASIKYADIWASSSIGDGMIFVSMNVGVDGSHGRFVSRELTPHLYDKLNAAKGAKDAGYKLVTDEKGVTDKDLADGAVVYSPDNDNGLIRVDLKNGDKKLVAKENTPKLFDFLSSKRDEFSSGDRMKAVNDARAKAGLPPVKDIDIATLETTEKGDKGQKLTVTELAWKNAMAKWKDGIDKGEIKADDDRAKLFRALQAQAISADGMDMATLDIGMGYNTQKTKGKDFDQIIDKDGIAKGISELLGSDVVAKDIATERTAALGKVENSAKVINDLKEMAFSTKYATYIQGLIKDGKKEAAQDDIAATYSSLLVADPDKAKEFAQNMQINSMTMELDSLIGDPGKISEENRSQAGTDIVKMLLTIAKKGGLDIGRRLAESEKFLNEVLGNKQTAKDFGKAMQQLGAIYSKNGAVTADDITSLFKNGTYKSLSEMPGGGGLKFFNDMTKAGVIGSIGGGISIVSGIYQLASKGGKIGNTHEERLAVAKDFVAFIGAGKHFADLAGNIIGEHNKGVKAYNDSLDPLQNGAKKPFKVPLIGLDKSLEELWYKGPSDKIGGGDEKKLTGELRDAFVNEVYRATSATDKPDFYNKLLADAGVTGEADLIKGFEKGYQTISPDIKWKDPDGKEISAKAWQKGASATLLILSAGADTFGGAADVALGALTIQKGVSSGDKTTVAKGALQVAAGGFGTIGGLASVSGLSKGLGFVKAIAAPSLVISAILSIATLIPDIINDIKRTKSIKDYQAKMEALFAQLDKDGYLQKGGLDKYRFLDAYMINYGQRDTPDDQSILDYRKDELIHFLDYWAKHAEPDQFTSGFGLFDDGRHADYRGDGSNLVTDLERNRSS